MCILSCTLKEERNIRISKVLKELNISLDRAVDFLKEKGIFIESNINVKISESINNVLIDEFANDKTNKAASLEINEEKRKERELIRLAKEKEDKERLIAEEKNIRISKVLKELNISLDRAVDFLKEKGIKIDSNINGKISSSVYNILLDEFDKLKSKVDQSIPIIISNNVEDIEKKYYIEIINGSNRISFEIKNIPNLSEIETSKLITKEIIKELGNLYEANEKLKILGYNRNYFSFTIFRNCILKVSFENNIILNNLEFSFKKILELEKRNNGLGQEYLSKLIYQKFNKNNNISQEIQNKEEYNQQNPYNEDVKTVLENNYGIKTIKTLEYNNQILESKFTDFQAFHICKGIKNYSYLHNKYINNKPTEEDIFLAHKFANQILNEKGKRMIDYILTLPSLPFEAEQFKILFSTLDKIRLEGKNETPIIRLKIPNEDGTNDEIEFSFYAIDGKKYVNQIIAKNKTKKNEMFSVTRNGVVLPKNNNLSNGKNLNITPVLQFFYHISKTSKNYNEAILSYGLESGKCSVCGRELNDEKSKLKGIEPVCFRILNS